MSRLCWKSGVPWSLPPALFQAARTLESKGMWVSPEELPHQVKGMEVSWELWGPHLISARLPTQV